MFLTAKSNIQSIVVVPTTLLSRQHYKNFSKRFEIFNIKVGEIFQAVLSQRFSNDYLIDPFNFYRALRSINPSPYLVFLNLKNYQIICSSPETMIKVKNKEITLRPIAGTRRRGKNEIEDNNLKNELLKDKKELAEHLMLVDLGRNDVGQISKNNTVYPVFHDQHSNITLIFISISHP